MGEYGRIQVLFNLKKANQKQVYDTIAKLALEHDLSISQFVREYLMNSFLAADTTKIIEQRLKRINFRS